MTDRNYTEDELEEVARLRDVLFATLHNLKTEVSRVSQEVIRMNKILDHNIFSKEEKKQKSLSDFLDGIDI